LGDVGLDGGELALGITVGALHDLRRVAVGGLAGALGLALGGEADLLRLATGLGEDRRNLVVGAGVQLLGRDVGAGDRVLGVRVGAGHDIGRLLLRRAQELLHAGAEAAVRRLLGLAQGLVGLVQSALQLGG